MRPATRFVLRFLKWYPAAAKHSEERLKLAAGGCQLIAIALVGAAYIAPMFNTSLGASIWVTAAAAGVAALLEGVAMKLLGYIPIVPEVPAAKEPTDA